jgi:hypothetical protein
MDHCHAPRLARAASDRLANRTGTAGRASRPASPDPRRPQTSLGRPGRPVAEEVSLASRTEVDEGRVPPGGQDTEARQGPSLSWKRRSGGITLRNRRRDLAPSRACATIRPGKPSKKRENGDPVENPTRIAPSKRTSRGGSRPSSARFRFMAPAFETIGRNEAKSTTERSQCRAIPTVNARATSTRSWPVAVGSSSRTGRGRGLRLGWSRRRRCCPCRSHRRAGRRS